MVVMEGQLQNAPQKDVKSWMIMMLRNGMKCRLKTGRKFWILPHRLI